MKYRVIIEPDEDGMFVAYCPALPGCISQGKTRAEALANIKDAMTGYLASLKKHGQGANIAVHVSAAQARASISSRAKRVNWERVDEILARVPNNSPLPGDEMD
jgi:predicted RNase H-like HicB family nuclease